MIWPHKGKKQQIQVDLLLLCIELCVLCSLQSLCQLIGAGGGLHAAADAFHTGDDIVDVHSLYQRADAHQIAIAAAEELNIVNLAVFNFKGNLTGAGALGLVIVLHAVIPFCIQIFPYYTILFISFQVGIFCCFSVILRKINREEPLWTESPMRI